MRRIFTLVLATVAVAALAVPASASSGSAVNPAAYCRAAYQAVESPVAGVTYNAYVVPVAFTFGGQTFVDDFALGSFQACVSTVAAGYRDGVIAASAISKPAYLAQCDFLEAWGIVSYPYTFYGLYPAQNRADCARILQGVHSGTLPLPGPPPNG
jgi:hypothetical protein